jgi:CRP-like cAMP-binding protein
MKIKNFFEN